MDILVLNAKQRIGFNRIYKRTIRDTINDLSSLYGISELIALSSGIISDIDVIPNDYEKITYVPVELYNTLTDNFQLNNDLKISLKLSESVYDQKCKYCKVINSCILFTDILNNNNILPDDTRLIELEEKSLMIQKSNIINAVDQFQKNSIQYKDISMEYIFETNTNIEIRPKIDNWSVLKR